MKHYALGLIFNQTKNKILLVKKNKPKWMAGYWNGLGGKIEGKDDSPFAAMEREALEEASYSYTFHHTITFVCPGGTVFVFETVCLEEICFKQTEKEELRVWPLYNLPENMMANLRWIIPLSLSSVQFPVVIQQNELGVV